MEGTLTQPVTAQSNHCSQCKMAPYCLPAKLDTDTIKIARYLTFHSRSLEPGEHLCRQGTLTDSIFLIRSGMLKSYFNKEDGEEYVMDFHFPPELFGWEGIDLKQTAYSVIALDFSYICEIPMPQLKQLLRKNPPILDQFFTLLNSRIRNDNRKQLRTTAEQRIAEFILQLVKHYKRLGFGYDMCKLLMTHQDIANYLRLAPATVSRLLHQLQSKNILSIQKKKIFVNDKPELTAIAKGLIHR